MYFFFGFQLDRPMTRGAYKRGRGGLLPEFYGILYVACLWLAFTTGCL